MKMEISRVVIICVVFMLTWKESLSQQVSGNKLEIRSKRYRETDKLKRASHQVLLNERENEVLLKRQLTAANGIPLGASQIRRPVILANKIPTKPVVPDDKFQQHRGNNEIDNLVNHKPYVLFVKEDDAVDKEHYCKVNKTDIKTDDKIKKAKKKTVARKTMHIAPGNETCSIDQTKIVDDSEKNLEEKPEETMKEHRITQKSRKDVGKQSKLTSSLKRPKPKLTPEINIKDKTIAKSDSEDNRHDNKHKLDETVEDHSAENYDVEKYSLKKEVQRKPKHSRPHVQSNKKTVESKIGNSKNCDDEKPVDKKPIKTEKENASERDEDDEEEEKNYENEGVLIKNNNYEEVFELTPFSELNKLNLHTTHEKIKSLPNNVNLEEGPELEYNNINNYVSKNDCYNNENNNFPVDFGLNYNEYSSHDPNEQIVAHTDDATYVSYNNFYEMPQSNSEAKNYGYLTPRHESNQCWEQKIVESLYNKPNFYDKNNVVESNPWNQNKAIENQRQIIKENAARVGKDRVWRTWKNTEYLVKSKNALNQLNKKLYQDLANQNKLNVDKVKFIQRRNAIGSIGCYQNQNN